MNSLPINWLTEGLIDFEYKQYKLLAYLQDVHLSLNNKILYPPLSELIEHHKNLEKIKLNFDKINTSTKGELKGIDWQNLSLIYAQNDERNTLDNITILKQIIDFSLPTIEHELKYGKEVYTDVEKNIKYESVGLLPIIKNEGYFFIQNYPKNSFYAYRYEISSIYSGIEQTATLYKTLKTEFISEFTSSISNTLYTIKKNFINTYSELPNPAVYCFFPYQQMPLEQTIIPVVKRLLLKITR